MLSQCQINVYGKLRQMVDLIKIEHSLLVFGGLSSMMIQTREIVGSIFAGTTHADGILPARMEKDATRHSS